MSVGLPGDVKPVAEDVSELRIDYGAGYRVYFKRGGLKVTFLLAGGDKSTQESDIALALKLARNLWEAFMAKTKTRRYNVVNYLKTERDVAGYFEATLEDGDPAVVAAALRDIARMRGMANVARKTGFQRENLYRAL